MSVPIPQLDDLIMSIIRDKLDQIIEDKLQKFSTDKPAVTIDIQEYRDEIVSFVQDDIDMYDAIRDCFNNHSLSVEFS